MSTRMQQRRGTAAEWAATDPILSPGELGVELDTLEIKIGNGVDAWSALQLPFLQRNGGELTGKLIFPVGDVNNPSVTFSGSEGTGLYLAGPDNMRWVAAGDPIFGVTATEFRTFKTFIVNAGTAAEPGLELDGGLGTGLFRGVGGELGFTVDGTSKMNVSTTAVNVTAAILSAVGINTSADINVGGALGVTGASTISSLSATTITASGAVTLNSTLGVTGDSTLGVVNASTVTTTGMLTVGGTLLVLNGVINTSAPNDLDFRTGGSTRGFYDHSADKWNFSASTQVLIPNGTATVPGLAFSSDPNTGISWGGADSIDIIIGGAVSWFFNSAGDFRTTAGSKIFAGSGTVSAPAYAFQNDTDCGLYLHGTNTVGVTSALYVDGILTVNSRIHAIEGGRDSVSIRMGADNDSGFFGDISLDRIATTVNLTPAGPEVYSSTITTGYAFVPGTDDVNELGNATFRWDNIYATNATIQTSDLDSKSQIWSSDLGMSFVRSMRPIGFVRDGGTRPHYGFGAQHVKEAIDALGIPDFAGLVDAYVNPPDPAKWPEYYEEDGVTPKKKGNRFGLRTEEFIAPLYAAFNNLVDQYEELVESLNTLVPGLNAPTPEGGAPGLVNVPETPLPPVTPSIPTPPAMANLGNN